jgi:hypothetical protein
MVNVGYKTLEAEDLTSKHRLLVDESLACKLGLAASFFNKIKIFCYFSIIDDLFPTIICILFVEL